MTHVDELSALGLEHLIYYGVWREDAAYDPLPEEPQEAEPSVDGASPDAIDGHGRDRQRDVSRRP